MALLDTKPVRLALRLICLGPAREKSLPFLETVRSALVNSKVTSKYKAIAVEHISFRDKDYDLLEFALPIGFSSSGSICQIFYPHKTTDAILNLATGYSAISVLFCVDASSSQTDIAGAFEEMNAQLAFFDMRFGYKYDAVPILVAFIGDSESDFALVPDLEKLLPVEDPLVHKLRSRDDKDILRAFSDLINAICISTSLGETESSDLTVHLCQ
ncbi:MAG: hypothetical protein BWY75_01854 [bacterium ADurb.Bin425]|nr:MAG: hypothetical protein BWY75_01854 [bacterium ADurb.Bin425]